MLSGKLQFKLKLKTMRVVCIKDPSQWILDEKAKNIPIPKKGDICTVLKHIEQNKKRFLILIEYGNKNAYWEGNFVEINEDQQDETEMERNLLHEKIEL